MDVLSSHVWTVQYPRPVLSSANHGKNQCFCVFLNALFDVLVPCEVLCFLALKDLVLYSMNALIAARFHVIILSLLCICNAIMEVFSCWMVIKRTGSKDLTIGSLVLLTWRISAVLINAHFGYPVFISLLNKQESSGLLGYFWSYGCIVGFLCC